MRAQILEVLQPLTESSTPLRWAEMPTPQPGPGEVLLHVRACGVCHTELDEIEGRLVPAELPIIPGHQVIAEVAGLGEGTSGVALGDRVGVGWIHHSDGTPLENLSSAFVATGCDAHGGYAQFMTVPAAYVVPIPEAYTDAEAAPLLCGGAIGYRALRLTNLIDGQPLGLTGFGGSAHQVLHLARHLFPASPVYVFARDAEVRRFALSLGADWSGDTTDTPPRPLQAIIDTTPAWRPVVAAMAALVPGGRLVINAIRKEKADQEALQDLSYHEHLWLEREIKSVANITHRDIREYLPIAAAAGIRPTVETYPLKDANQALLDLKFRPTRGAKVLIVD